TRGLVWIEDASNRDARFLRNRIRHEALPFLAQLCGADVVEPLCRSAGLKRGFVDGLARGGARGAGVRRGARGARAASLPWGGGAPPPPGAWAAGTRRGAAGGRAAAPRRRAAVPRPAGPRPPGAPARRGARLGSLAVERSGRWLRVGPAELPPLQPRSWPVPG